MQLVGLRGQRMKFYLENILAGKVSVATAAKQAQRVKSRLRFRNYLLDSISILRQGNMTWGEAEITWECFAKMRSFLKVLKINTARSSKAMSLNLAIKKR